MKRLMFLTLFCTIIPLTVNAVSAQEVKQLKTGTISGQLMIKDDVPMSGGRVFFFKDTSGPPPSQEKYWRVPDYIVDIDNNGRFSAVLSEGKYYLGAVKTISGEKIGPPKEGDIFYAGVDERGKQKTYIINQGQETDLGVITGAVPFKRSVVKFTDGITAIEGTVLDIEGKPVEGALVFAFLTPSRIGKPLFASERTGKDGRYIIRVHEGGNYYLKARSLYGGGLPKTGEIIGDFGEKGPVAVNVKNGEKLRGVDIKVKRFIGRGPKAQDKNKNL